MNTQLHSTKQCALCKEHKPKAEFKRTLTLRQTKALLRSSTITTRHTSISKNCKACRKPRGNKRRKLSIKDIRHKVASGDMHQLVGEARIKQMVENLPKTRSRVMRAYWQKKKNEPLTTLMASLAKEAKAHRNRYHALKSKDPSNPLIPIHLSNYLKTKEELQRLGQVSQTKESSRTTTKPNQRKAGVV